MQKSLFVFALLCVGWGLSWAWGQPFRPIQSYGGRWKMETYSGNMGPSCSVVQDYYLTTTGDTTIAGWDCVRLERSQAYYCDWSGPAPCFAPWSPAIAGYLHMDSGGRLYEVDLTGTRYAILDFSLGVGDTMHTSHPQRGTIDYVVDSIDTVTFIDGIARRRQYVTSAQFANSIPQGMWVEGIGDLLHGPLPIEEYDHRQINLCYTDKAQLWQTTLGSQCPADCDVLSGRAAPTESLWTVAPNPTASSWRLTCSTTPAAETLRLKVCDVRGRVLLEQTLLDPASIDIALPEAAPGLYMASIYNETGRLWQVKLMKQ